MWRSGVFGLEEIASGSNNRTIRQRRCSKNVEQVQILADCLDRASFQTDLSRKNFFVTKSVLMRDYTNVIYSKTQWF